MEISIFSLFRTLAFTSRGREIRLDPSRYVTSYVRAGERWDGSRTLDHIVMCIYSWWSMHDRGPSIERLECMSYWYLSSHNVHLSLSRTTHILKANLITLYIQRESYYPTAGYKITYSVATLSYDNCYANLRDYSNSLLCDLLEHYGKYPHVL
jgi:hypothetical protein